MYLFLKLLFNEVSKALSMIIKVQTNFGCTIFFSNTQMLSRVSLGHRKVWKMHGVIFKCVI